MKNNPDTFVELTAFDGEIEVYFHVRPGALEVIDAYVHRSDVDYIPAFENCARFKKEWFKDGLNPLFVHAVDIDRAKKLWKSWRKWISREDIAEAIGN